MTTMERLLFRLDEIPPEGMEFDLAPDPAIYRIGDVDIINPPGMSGWVRVDRDGRDLEISGLIRAQVELPCDRCLAPARHPVEGEFRFRLVPRTEMPGGEDTELFHDELEIEFYDGQQVDVRRIIEEQVYLNLPMRSICAEDCRGLCPVCGQDLNQGGCGHRGGPGGAS
jgi:uncharacterized protein